jgi:hypothetical protein
MGWTLTYSLPDSHTHRHQQQWNQEGLHRAVWYSICPHGTRKPKHTQGAKALTVWVIEEEELAHISSYHMLTTDQASTKLVNSLTAIRSSGRNKWDSYGRNSTKSTVNPNTTIPQTTSLPWWSLLPLILGGVSMDPPDMMQITSSKGVGLGRLGWVSYKSLK